MADMITEPGVYSVPAQEYHADPVQGGSLSSTGARKLLPPSCPALFKHWQDNGGRPSRAFDFGHAAHLRVLGTGPELVLIKADNYRTKAAQQARDEAHEQGAVPLLPDEHATVLAMAAALRAHPVAAALFAHGSGLPEQTLVWRDTETGVTRRAMLDWLPESRPGRGLIVPDYKTAAHADVPSFEKAMADYGYHQQADWYLDGVRALGLSDLEPAFVFVVQEKNPPYLVNVIQPDVVALKWGHIQNEAALAVYRQCVATGRWPGYSDRVELGALPRYAEYRIETDYEQGAYRASRDVTPR
jgi:hypothetical protein